MDQGRGPAGGRARVIFLSQIFDPEPAHKGLAFIKSLAAQGFDIEVVTGFPNYPGGTVYPGFRIRPLQRDSQQGISVTRLAVYPSHDSSALRRIACYASFAATSLLYLLFRAKRAEMIFVSYPSLTAGLSAVVAKFFRRTPVVLDIQDMWPDSLSATGMMNSRWLLAVIGWLCGVLYKAVDHIVVLSPSFKTLLEARGVSGAKISVIYNWADESAPEAMPDLPAGFEAGDAFRVLFAGNMGAAQGLDSVLEAAQLVAARQPGVLFYFLGSGLETDRLKAIAAKQRIANVRFLPRVPAAAVAAYLRAADALLVHLKDDPLFAITIPSKTQSYMQAGRPILMGVRGDAAELIERAEAGIVVAPENPAALADAVLELHGMSVEARNAIGENARNYYSRFLSLDRATARIANILRKDYKMDAAN